MTGIVTKDEAILATPTVYFNVPNWVDSRKYTTQAWNSSFIQYIANCMLDFTPDYDTTASHEYKVYFAPTISETVVPTQQFNVPSTIQFNTTTSGNATFGSINYNNIFSGFATYGYHNSLASYVPIQLNSVGRTIEVNDLVCNKINGQQMNFGIFAYGGYYGSGTYLYGNSYTSGIFNVNSTLNQINSTLWQVAISPMRLRPWAVI
jgi:hypothetical protein